MAQRIDTPVRWGAIFAGAALCLAVQMAFVFLGAGLGLTAIPWETAKEALTDGNEPLRWAAIIFSALALGIAFFIGGGVSAYLSGYRSRKTAILHGLASWSVVALALVVFATRLSASALGPLLDRAGLGAGAAAGISTAMKELSQTQLRVVTDLSILKGKAVSDLYVSRKDDTIAPDAVRQVKKEVASVKRRPEVREPVEEAAKTVKKTAGPASLAAGGALLFGALAAALGGWLGRRRFDDIPPGGARLRAA